MSDAQKRKPFYRRLYEGWLAIAGHFGECQTLVVIGISYVLVIGPMSLVMGRKDLLQKRALDEECISLIDLAAAGHKQGFESLDQVERCVLEPSGGMSFFGRKPSSDDLRQDALVQRLDRIEALLKTRIAT